MYRKVEIEEMAVEFIKKQLRITGQGKLNGYINTNDKEPSWDGNININEFSGNIGTEIFGRLPVQVKGKQVKELSKDNKKHTVKIRDLKNYNNDNGVLYFIVEIVDEDIYKIFYKALLPVDIECILQEVKVNGKSNQNAISLEFLNMD